MPKEDILSYEEIGVFKAAARLNPGHLKITGVVFVGAKVRPKLIGL